MARSIAAAMIVALVALLPATAAADVDLRPFCTLTIAEISHSDFGTEAVLGHLYSDESPACRPNQVALARRIVDNGPQAPWALNADVTDAPGATRRLAFESLARGVLLRDATSRHDTATAGRLLRDWTAYLDDFLHSHPEPADGAERASDGFDDRKREATRRLGAKLVRMQAILAGRPAAPDPNAFGRRAPIPPDWQVLRGCTMTSVQFDAFDVIPDEIDALVAVGRPLDALQFLLDREWRYALEEGKFPNRAVALARLVYSDAGLSHEFDQAIASLTVEPGIGGRYAYITVFGVRRPVPLTIRYGKSEKGGPPVLPTSGAELAGTWRTIFDQALRAADKANL